MIYYFINYLIYFILNWKINFNIKYFYYLKFRYIEKPDKDTLILYYRANAFIMSDRDFVLKFENQIFKDNTGFKSITNSVTRADTPVIKGVVSAE